MTNEGFFCLHFAFSVCLQHRKPQELLDTVKKEKKVSKCLQRLWQYSHNIELRENMDLV